MGGTPNVYINRWHGPRQTWGHGKCVSRWWHIAKTDKWEWRYLNNSRLGGWKHKFSFAANTRSPLWIAHQVINGVPKASLSCLWSVWNFVKHVLPSAICLSTTVHPNFSFSIFLFLFSIFQLPSHLYSSKFISIQRWSNSQTIYHCSLQNSWFYSSGRMMFSVLSTWPHSFSLFGDHLCWSLYRSLCHSLSRSTEVPSHKISDSYFLSIGVDPILVRKPSISLDTPFYRV